MTDPTIHTIVERGFVPDPEEYELIEYVLRQFRTSAKEQGHLDIAKRVRVILTRLAQVVQAPNGLTQEQIDNFRQRAREGLEARDSAKLAGGIQDLIASTLRTDPEPAEKIAGYLLQLVADLMMAHRSSDFAVLERLSSELEASKSDWEQNGWPTTQNVVDWFGEMIEIGKDNLAQGREPWPSDDEESKQEG